jgi:DNA polymerase (family X)
VAVVEREPRRALGVTVEGVPVELVVAKPARLGTELVRATGSPEYVAALEPLPEAEDEEGVYRALGIPFVPPELREDGFRGEPPRLLELADVRGDLHTHTTWSDGRDTLEQMVLAAQARGYAYYAVTDHPRGTLAEQDAEIDELNERLKPFRILKGIEVNIRIDGSLSLTDAALAKRDWVMASLHGAFDRDPTERILAAMDNPHVHCIGHLTARKINIRKPADVNIDSVVAKALETGTFLEINAQPNRLDIRDAHARLAGEAGVKIAVNTDAHQLSALEHMEMGIAQARRAWLTKDQVLNTRTWPQIEKLLK